MNLEIKKDVEILWDYLCLKSEPVKCECIIGLGSILKCIPEKCSELYKKHLGDYIIFSGNCGKGTEGVIKKTEAGIFKSIAIKEGTPEKNILVENKATNTYENFKYLKKVLREHNLKPQSFLIVGKPYQERRAYNIAAIEFQNLKIAIASFNISFNDFLNYVITNNLMSEEDLINEIVAEININLLAPKYGLQKEDSIPNSVLASYERLCASGYTRYLLTDELIVKVIEEWKALNIIS